jgi:hypothetical protein
MTNEGKCQVSKQSVTGRDAEPPQVVISSRVDVVQSLILKLRR